MIKNTTFSYNDNKIVISAKKLYLLAILNILIIITS